MLSEQFGEVIVLRYDDDRTDRPSRCEDFGIAGTMQPEFLDMHRIRVMFRPDPLRQCGRKLSVNPERACRTCWRLPLADAGHRSVYAARTG